MRTAQTQPDIMIQDVVQVFIWTFALGAALAIPMSVRKSASLCIGWLAIYTLAYSFLSMNGRYAPDTLKGESRWMPMHCERVVFERNREIPKLNGMGAFFAPLVLADRVVMHRSKPTTATAGMLVPKEVF